MLDCGHNIHNGFLVGIGKANAVIFVLNDTGYVLRDNGARAHIHNVDSNYCQEWRTLHEWSVGRSPVDTWTTRRVIG